jgi:RNA polymerase sigma-70 factor, ECF subfamily
MATNQTQFSSTEIQDNLAQANSDQFGVPADRLPRLYQIALKVLHNPADAADAVQQGLLLAYAKRQQFRGQSKFTSWVTRIIINSALMHRRRQKCAPPTVPLEAVPDGQVSSLAERIADPGPNPEQWYADKELYERLGSYLQSLSPVRRITFLLRAVQGLSTRETARTLRVSENAVKTNYLHSRRQLAALFRNELRPSP